MTATSGRGPYIPTPEALNGEFYAHARSGTLHLQRCTGCGAFRHPPRYVCASCGARAFEWVASPGRGTLFSWTVTHRPYDRGWADQLPYVTGVIELEEGVRLVGALHGYARDELALGLALRVRLEPRTEDFTFIALIPVGDPPTAPAPAPAEAEAEAERR
ncbi:MAG: Zn-ribbon domain-containing OB-fold protein [Solirubrobacteraceae bacterium]